jgi:hypothetical protein
MVAVSEERQADDDGCVTIAEARQGLDVKDTHVEDDRVVGLAGLAASLHHARDFTERKVLRLESDALGKEHRAFRRWS